MNATTLTEIVARGESERLELKRSTGQRTDAAKTACAMLNGLGGTSLASSAGVLTIAPVRATT